MNEELRGQLQNTSLAELMFSVNEHINQAEAAGEARGYDKGYAVGKTSSLTEAEKRDALIAKVDDLYNPYADDPYPSSAIALREKEAARHGFEKAIEMVGDMLMEG